MKVIQELLAVVFAIIFAILIQSCIPSKKDAAQYRYESNSKLYNQSCVPLYSDASNKFDSLTVDMYKPSSQYNSCVQLREYAKEDSILYKSIP